MESNSLIRRIKLYKLNNDGQWDDQGTGHVDYGYEHDGGLVITARQENTNEEILLLTHRVEPMIDYQRQGKTIITWCDVSGIDLAMSFQDENRCTELFDEIEKVKQEFMNMNEYAFYTELVNLNLPEPSVDTIEEICIIVYNSYSAHPGSLAIHFLDEDFLDKLFKVFDILEEKNLLSQLHQMFQIFRTVIMLNRDDIIELLLNDKYILKVMACLEYDMDLPPGMDTHRHRSFFNKSQLKLVVPINDTDLLEKIRQNFRINYLKDVVLLRYLDDATMTTLTGIIFQNNNLIVTSITVNMEFLDALFEAFNDVVEIIPETTHLISHNSNNNIQKQHHPNLNELLAKKKSLFMFLEELCNIAKTLQLPVRHAFVKALDERDVFKCIERALLSSHHRIEHWLYLCCTDIMSSLSSHDPTLFRYYLTKSHSRSISWNNPNNPNNPNIGNTLIGLICNTIIHPTAPSGLALQLVQLIRVTLDREFMKVDASRCKRFLDCIFLHHFCKFASILNTTGHAYVGLTQAKFHICELFTYSVVNHPAYTKRVILEHNVLTKLAIMCEQHSRDSFLVCAGLRLLRRIISTLDYAYMSRIVNEKVLDPYIEAFLHNGARYNLLNSVFIELATFIHKQNIRPLVEYLADSDKAKELSNISYVNIFQDIKLQYGVNLSTRWGDNKSNSRAINKHNLDDDIFIDEYDDFDYLKEDIFDEAETSLHFNVQTNSNNNNNNTADDDINSPMEDYELEEKVAIMQKKRTLEAEDEDRESGFMKKQLKMKRTNRLSFNLKR